MCGRVEILACRFVAQRIPMKSIAIALCLALSACKGEDPEAAGKAAAAQKAAQEQAAAGLILRWQGALDVRAC